MGLLTLSKSFNSNFLDKQRNPKDNVVIDYDNKIIVKHKPLFVSSGGMQDLVSKQVLVKKGAGVDIATSGEAFELDGATSASLAWEGVRISGAITIIIRISTNESNINFCRIFAAQQAFGSSFGFALVLRPDFNRIQLRGSGGSELVFTGATTLLDGAKHDIICSIDAAGNATIFYDGVTGLTGTVTAISGTPQGLAVFDEVGTPDNTTFKGKIYHAYILDGAVDAKTAKELSDDPYQILKPSNPISYFIPSAGAPPATSIPVIMNHYKRMRA